MSDTLVKSSPLCGVYSRLEAECTDVAGWRVARHFGDADAEARHLEDGALLVDWSPIGKVSVRGPGAAQEMEKLAPGAAALSPGQTLRAAGTAVLRLTGDEFFVLCMPGREAGVLDSLDPAQASVIDQTGGMGCLVLAGPRRDEVMERSCAMNLRRDRVGDYAAVQTTVHVVPVVLYRMPRGDALLSTRDYVEFLFDAFLDVGRGVGLRPGGLAALDIDFGESEAP